MKTRTYTPALLLLTLSLTGLASGRAAAQTALDLPAAVARALASGPDLTTSRANLQKAQANYASTAADPTSIITTKLSAKQGLESAQLNVLSTKLNVMQTVVSGYINAYETALKVDLYAAQQALNSRTLAITQAKQKAGTATALDVTKAQNTLNSTAQDLSDARAQLPILEAQLGKTLGLSGDLKLQPLPKAPALNVSLASLQTNLDTRLSGVQQAAQSVASAQLTVDVSNNDYTPARTLQDAQTALSNAQRSLQDAQKSAQNSLKDAYRSAQNAEKQVGIAAASLSANQTTLAQTQARLKAGTAAAVDVQSAQVNVQQAQLTLTQAQDALWKALAALSAASGQDLTGLVK
ncbi:TolC family protein [Deinococcus ruber]|uniref:Transporter n=1 Tax=Deinococcus ruber TaxID=1848197 RepID=A0A918C0H6_9DEIO|nr:TolC family protein [Deinococcus ruber]GGR00739.1 transporter [Deinococcus ruber]